MDEKVWFRSHVERLLEQVWDARELTVAPDGLYYGEAGTAVAWVSVETDSPMARFAWSPWSRSTCRQQRRCCAS